MNKTQKSTLLLIMLGSLLVLLMAGCSGGDNQEEAAAVPASEDHSGHDHAAGEHGEQAADHAAPSSNAFLAGVIKETMNSGGYSYVLMDTGDSDVWVAGSQRPGLEVGQMVSIPDGMEMKNFTAKSLDRVFESIYFTGAINSVGDEAGQAGSSGMSGMSGANPHSGSADKPISGTNTQLEKATVTSVEKLEGGHTIAEIYANTGTLGGKSIKLRAEVVKFSPNIMGTNWMHVQDGTGEAQTSDLTVTTGAVVGVGDIVVIEGALSVDKDFGAGYKYHVIIEGASVTRQ